VDNSQLDLASLHYGGTWLNIRRRPSVFRRSHVFKLAQRGWWMLDDLERHGSEIRWYHLHWSRIYPSTTFLSLVLVAGGTDYLKKRGSEIRWYHPHWSRIRRYRLYYHSPLKLVGGSVLSILLWWISLLIMVN
jgi:hypothetical protein